MKNEKTNIVKDKKTASKPIRVLRGGSWIDDARYARVSNRSRNDASRRSDDQGFRLVLQKKKKKK
jgi:formylglycine-generating enzyme required for sulfatase activity